MEKISFTLLHFEIHTSMPIMPSYIKTFLSEQFTAFARPILTTIEALDTSRLPIVDIEKL